MSIGRQPRCSVCAKVPVAMRGVAFCFTCWPGGPVTPPPCLRCGSGRDYYTSGLCARCHTQAIPPVDSCLDCYAWGATRNSRWLCRACLSWRQQYPQQAPCATCGRTVSLGPHGSCRLCHKQAGLLRTINGRFDLAGANRHGHQLFFAGMFHENGARTRAKDTAAAQPRRDVPAKPPTKTVKATATDVFGEQLRLFTIRHDLAAAGRPGLRLRADPAQAAALESLARDLAAAASWRQKQLQDNIIGIRIVLGLQPGGRPPVRASEVDCLKDIDLPVRTVLEVLDAASVLIEDRTPAIDAWFNRQISGLPGPMVAELTTWFEVMKHGSPTAPRRRPRSERTITLHLGWAAPTLRAWAATGHSTLREITKEHVLDALPAAGNPRSTTGQGLKSIFRLLKARKVLFTDPTTRVKTGQHESRQPLPLDVAIVRAALRSRNPAQAVLVALIAFHGLRTGHLERLRLTDVRDGHLHVDGRVVPLADPVRERLRAYLTHRNTTWPRTTNGHLFINRHTSRRDSPASRRWLGLTLGPDLTVTALREDRILNETNANGGDVRALADLFGLSINASTRYAATISHPDLDPGSPTHAPR